MTAEQEVDKLAETEVEAGKPQSKFASYLSQARLKLKPGLNYVLDGFPPVIAVIALIVAVYAMSESRSLRAQLTSAVAKVESLSTGKAIPSREDLDKLKVLLESLDKGKASFEELEKVKAVMAQEKVMHDAELIKQSERNTKIIHGVSKLQVKMKVSPTLESQMREPVIVPKSAPAHETVITPTAAIKAVPVPAQSIILSKPEVAASAIPAPVKPAKKADEPAVKPPAAAVSADPKKQREAQVKSIKEQIEEFNRK